MSLPCTWLSALVSQSSLTLHLHLLIQPLHKIYSARVPNNSHTSSSRSSLVRLLASLTYIYHRWAHVGNFNIHSQRAIILLSRRNCLCRYAHLLGSIYHLAPGTMVVRFNVASDWDVFHKTGLIIQSQTHQGEASVLIVQPRIRALIVYFPYEEE